MISLICCSLFPLVPETASVASRSPRIRTLFCAGLIANSKPSSLAYAEMRLILARVIYNFDMQLVDEDHDWMDQKVYILWIKHKLEVFLTPVKREH